MPTISHTLPNRFASNANSKGIISAGILVLAVIIAFFATSPLYYSYVATLDRSAELVREKTEKTNKLATLNSLKTEASDPKIKSDIDRYASKYSEDIYISVLLASNPDISVSGLTLGSGERLANGFSLANFGFSFQATNEKALLAFLDSLTSANAQKRFVIKNIGYPLNTAQYSLAPISVSIQLGSYYLSR